MDDCVFCKIAGGKIPAYVIDENEHALAFLDISADAEGHTLVIPKAHYTNLLDCPLDVLGEVMRMAKRIAGYYVDTLGYTGVNLLNNNGGDAHQSVPHLHLHLYPRKPDDGLQIFPKLEKGEADLKAVWEKHRVRR